MYLDRVRGAPLTGLALEPGELVRFRERRAPPVLMLLVVPVGLLVTLAATAVPLAVRVVSVLGAVALWPCSGFGSAAACGSRISS